MTWSEFLAMGGYGAYVWSAYGLAAAVLLWNLIVAWRKQRLLVRELKRIFAQEKPPS
ncbi:MAG: heme exporter protein CcmD [Methylohalobius sp.]